MTSRSSSGLYLAVAFLSLGIVVLWRTRFGQGSFFGDDLMNLWVHSLRVPWWAEFSNAFTFAEPLDRSGGALFYRTLYSFFGLKFLPFQWAHDALVVLHNVLLAVFVRRVVAAGSPAGPHGLAIIALLQIPMFADLYLGLNMIYDLLVSILNLIVLLAVVTAGHSARPWRWLLAGLLAYQAALSTKEVALVVPLFLSLAAMCKLPWARWTWVFALLPQTAWYVYRKFASGNAMQTNAGYQVCWDWASVADNLVWYVRWLTDFFLNEPSPIGAAFLLLALAIAAFWFNAPWGRVAVLTMALCFGAFLLVYHRDLYAFYFLLPFAALALAGLLGRLRLGSSAWAGLAVLAAALGFFWTAARGEKYMVPLRVGMAPAKIALAALEANPPPATAKQFYVLRDPFPFDDYAVQMLLSLWQRDPGVTAPRKKFGKTPPVGGLQPPATIDLCGSSPVCP